VIYKIVSDSASNVFDIPGVEFSSAPLNLVFNDRDHVDNAALDVDAMLEEMRVTKARVTSSCPNVGEWLDGFEGADCVFATTITGGLSGSYNAAMQAREEFLKKYPDKKVHVFDSLSAGPEIRIIIEKIAELIREKLTFEAIVEKVTDYMKHTHLTFCLSSLINFARAGRIHPAKARFAGVLGIRVVGRASDVGTLQDLYKIRGEDKALSAMLREMLERGFCGGKVRIAHTHNENGAKKFATLIREKFPASDISIEKNAGLCSYYAEEGGILVGYEG